MDAECMKMTRELAKRIRRSKPRDRDFEEWLCETRDSLYAKDLNFALGRLCGMAEALDVTVGQLLDEAEVNRVRSE